MLKVIDRNQVPLIINDPVFPDTRSPVFEQLLIVVHGAACGGDDFDDPIRRPLAAFPSELFPIAYDRDVRFYVNPVVCIQEYGKRGGEDFAVPIVLSYIIPYTEGQFH